MSSPCMPAWPQSLSSLADSRVNDSLLQIISHFNKAPLQLVDVTYTTFTCICTLLHYSPDLVADGIQIWTVWRPEGRTDEIWCLPLQQLDGVVGTMCQSTVLLTDLWHVRLLGWKHLLRQQDITVIPQYIKRVVFSSPLAAVVAYILAVHRERTWRP